MTNSASPNIHVAKILSIISLLVLLVTQARMASALLFHNVSPSTVAPGDIVTISGDGFLPGVEVFISSNLTTSGSVDMQGFAGRLAVSGDYAYMGRDKSLKVIDISNPTAPMLIGGVETVNNTGMEVAGNYAYVTTGGYTAGLQIIDISVPASPLVVGSVSTIAPAQGVAVSGDYAYVALSHGIQVVDVSNRAAPVALGTLGVDVYAVDLAVSGHYAYLVGIFGAMQVFDINDAAAPMLVGSEDTVENGTSIAISENYAYVAGGRSLKVVNISDPAVPVLVGRSFSHTPSRVAVAGDYAYVAEGEGAFLGGGLSIHDISDPTTPRVIARVGTASSTIDVAVSGDYAYISIADGTFRVLKSVKSFQLTPSLVSATEIILPIPRHLPPGEYGLTIANPDGTRYSKVNSALTITDIPAPSLSDTDGDGLLDDWEVNGFTVDVNGVERFVDLPGMGASKDHKDIFVYINWFEDSRFFPFISHDHAPGSKLEKVVQAFASAPVDNPDGTTGINLHIVDGGSINETPENKTLGWIEDRDRNVIQESVNACEESYSWDEFNEIKRQNFPEELTRAFRYALFAHKLATGRSGISANGASGEPFEHGASDFIVTVGLGASAAQYGGTFMHELGHNLGLGHGGLVRAMNSQGRQIVQADHTNRKPNHLSVMNYSFQAGLRKRADTGFANGHLDYHRFSRITFLDLDEADITEVSGLGNLLDPTLLVYGSVFQNFSCGNRIQAINDIFAPINWNCNDTIENYGFVSNVNGLSSYADNEPDLDKVDFKCFPTETAVIETLTSTIDEWSHLVFNGGAIGGSGASELSVTPLATQQEMVAEELYAIGAPEPRVFEIDILPGSAHNPINIRSKGYLPVAILSNEDFNVADLDQKSLMLAGVPVKITMKNVAKAYEDVNGDGLLDLVVHFPREALNLEAANSDLTLTGRDKGGFSIVGSDSFTLIGHE